jgi:hypothetical protein
MSIHERALERSFDYYKILLSLPPAAKFIFYILDVKTRLTRTEIIKETLLPKRTVGAALVLLCEKNLIVKIKGSALKDLDCNYRKRIDFREVYYQIQR